MNVLMVEPGKAPYETQIGDDLQSMQSVVGGYIQAVYPYEEPVALICCESGKLDGLPLNRAPVSYTHLGRPHPMWQSRGWRQSG